MPIGFNNFNAGFKSGGINSASGKKNDGGSTGGTGYMQKRKKQDDEKDNELDMNGSIFGNDGGFDLHMPSDEELEKMMKETKRENSDSKLKKNVENSASGSDNIKNEKDTSANNFFNADFEKNEGNFFK